MTTKTRTWKEDIRDDAAEFTSDVVRTAMHIVIVYETLVLLHVSAEGSMMTGFTIASVRVFDAETRYFTRTIRRVLKRPPDTEESLDPAD